MELPQSLGHVLETFPQAGWSGVLLHRTNWACIAGKFANILLKYLIIYKPKTLISYLNTCNLKICNLR